ncbi:class I SAM-dependent methyltransferase [Niameybacter massiliensis]|uniref:Class I SAM-dependent methyltransferase n=1 Tax=Holtiella tumoricola TaxID=3018743 RepID=A0AA42DSL4_9FIRM|nr:MULTISPECIES: class I SAM-dependent methyltransferase [Lachnospirales]MDA3734158.1 class I SAM-dependent methyltransferase [Holtiella tumoricola]
MDIYNDFAMIYDTFMEDTPYVQWVDFIQSVIKEHGIEPKLICDLGCGTGTMCELFADRGLDVIGIDGSEEMLMIAREKELEAGRGILYLMQDMTEFELYGTVDVIYSSCDSINYLMEEEKVLSMFKWVNNYLEKDGLFIFDVNLPHKYKTLLGDKVFAEQTEEAAYIWENFYDEKQQINEFYVSFFVQDEDGRYDRFEEVHYQKAYSIECIKQIIEKAGLELVAIYDDYTHKSYNEETLRATFVAREKQVDGKVYVD